MNGRRGSHRNARQGREYTYAYAVAAGSLPPLVPPPTPRVRGSVIRIWFLDASLVISESSCVTYSRVACVRVYLCARGRRSPFTHALPQTNRPRASDGSRHFRRRAGTQNAGRERFRTCPLVTFYDHGCMCVYAYILHVARGSWFCDARQDTVQRHQGFACFSSYSLKMTLTFWVAGDQMSEPRRMLVHAWNLFIFFCLAFIRGNLMAFYG